MSNSDNTSSGSKKKKAAAAAVAVALAAALMIGGTFSYISSVSEEVENEFDTSNDLSVELSETTGKEYEVIPGTSEEKDPTVTLTTTMDTFVFLLVEDNTDGLVDYSIDSIWTLLYDADDEDNPASGYDVYYLLIDYDTYAAYTTTETDEDGNETTSSGTYDKIDVTLNVLTDQSVSYGSWITDEDLEDADDVTLSFTAYAIQAEPFLSDNSTESAAAASALEGYYAPQAKVTQISNPDTVTVYLGTSGSTIVSGTITPDVVYVFQTTEDSSSASDSKYASWIAEYVVTFEANDNDDEIGTVMIAGQYDYYSKILSGASSTDDDDYVAYWMPIQLGSSSGSSSGGVSTSETYYLMKDYVKYTLNYATLCNWMDTFNCGTVQTIDSSNADDNILSALSGTTVNVPDGTKITIELRLYESLTGSTYSDNYITIGSWTYTYGTDDSSITVSASTSSSSTDTETE